MEHYTAMAEMGEGARLMMYLGAIMAASILAMLGIIVFLHSRQRRISDIEFAKTNAFAEGKAFGYDEGYDVGLAEGYDAGLAEGYLVANGENNEPVTVPSQDEIEEGINRLQFHANKPPK